MSYRLSVITIIRENYLSSSMWPTSFSHRCCSIFVSFANFISLVYPLNNSKSYEGYFNKSTLNKFQFIINVKTFFLRIKKKTLTTFIETGPDHFRQYIKDILIYLCAYSYIHYLGIYPNTPNSNTPALNIYDKSP